VVGVGLGVVEEMMRVDLRVDRDLVEVREVAEVEHGRLRVKF
jgi:hypothetical protein